MEFSIFFFFFFNSHVLCSVGWSFQSCSTPVSSRGLGGSEILVPTMVLISQFGIPAPQEWRKLQTHTCLCRLKFPVLRRLLDPTLPRPTLEDRVSVAPFLPWAALQGFPMEGPIPVPVSDKSGTSSPVSELNSSPISQISVCLGNPCKPPSLHLLLGDLTLYSSLLCGTRDFYFLSLKLGYLLFKNLHILKYPCN